MGTKHAGRNCNNCDRERYCVQPDRERECALLVAQSVVVKKTVHDKRFEHEYHEREYRPDGDHKHEPPERGIE